jgi:hypothetical protein
MDKLKQKQRQRQSVNVVVNVAHPKLKRKSKRRVRAPSKKAGEGSSSLQSTYQQPLTKMIRYDVPVYVPSQPSAVLQSGVARAPEVTANKLIVDTPIEVMKPSPASQENLASTKLNTPAKSAFEEEAPFGYKKDGTPYKRKPKGYDLQYEQDVVDPRILQKQVEAEIKRKEDIDKLKKDYYKSLGK